MAIVIDDHLLIDVVAETTTGWLREQVDQSVIYTTSAWYYRVANAAHRGSGAGTLSRRLAQFPESVRRERIDNLPDWIGLLGPRLVVPVMATIATRLRPNVLTAEALAVAVITDGSLVVSIDSPLLRGGAADLGVEYRVVES
ncbi:MAG: hypothetical protein H6518_05590 [Microthrixaceae bacterium]|nr:hypothetical protein [Microthrixaceae bacterium]